MSRDIQQCSDSVSSPNCGQSHSETNQVPPESQRNNSVPDLEASNCTTGSMTAGNAQENQDSDDEPDACLPATHGYDSVPSVSEDYVPWFETHTFSPFFEGVIPEIFTVGFFLSALCFVLVFLTTFIQGVKSDPYEGLDAFMEFNERVILIVIGGLFDLCSATLYKLGLAFHADASRFKAAFVNKIWGLISLIYTLVCVGTLVAIYYASSYWFLFLGWYTGPLPQSFRGCEARVGPAQLSLFTEHIYARQFGRLQMADSSDKTNFLKFDMQAFDAIRHDQILCNQGFIGNSDLYGLGSRVSLYLQWLTALLVNNFVPRIRHEFRKVYLAYSLGLCIATFVFTFSKDCIFTVEIEILYWAYWGGFLCIFATSPSYIRLGSEVKWIGLDWITGINYFLHILMFYHSTFFWHYGYDQVFSRMPCGTYHFFFAPILDPGRSFWFFRDLLTIIIDPVNVVLIFIIPTVIFSLMSEIKESICGSSVYQNLGIHIRLSGRPTLETILAIDAAQASLSSRFRNSLRALGFFWVGLYRKLRVIFLLPPHSRGGIRLLTPVDIEQRKRYRIRCALSGLASCIVFITAIETTLQSNKVVGINSLASTGQYLAMILGVSTLITALWQVLKQETVRRRDLLRRHTLNEDTAEIELDTLPHTLSGAVRYAFGQVDVAFMTNGSVFEASSGTVAEESEDISEQALTPSNDPEDLYMMSGALATP